MGISWDKRRIDIFTVNSHLKSERNRIVMIQELQLKNIRNDERYLFECIEQYRSIIEQDFKDYDLLLRLEKKIDLLIEEYAKSKIYIHCK